MGAGADLGGEGEEASEAVQLDGSDGGDGACDSGGSEADSSAVNGDG